MNLDDIYQLNPLQPIVDNGGSNGQDDVEFKRMLRAEKFWVDLLGCSMLPPKHQRLYVVERMFVENYENIYITWVATLADGTVRNPFHFIGTHETDHEERREPGDFIGADGLHVPQATIDKFRIKAAEQLSHAQKVALDRTKPKKRARMTTFNGTPTNLL